MPLDALPDHLNSKEEIKNAFPDDSQYGHTWFGRLYYKFHKLTKAWLAFGPRSSHWWAKWRECPVVLWVAGDNYPYRFEYTDVTNIDRYYYTPLKYCKYPADYTPYYLSRIQYFKKWHIQVQWPLFICFHWYNEPIPICFPDEPKLKGWMGYIGFKRDADRVYWGALYLGKSWK